MSDMKQWLNLMESTLNQNKRSLEAELEESNVSSFHWPDGESWESELAQAAENAIQNFEYAYDAYDHVVSMAKTPEEMEWVRSNKKELVDMFKQYGLESSEFDESDTSSTISDEVEQMLDRMLADFEEEAAEMGYYGSVDSREVERFISNGDQHSAAEAMTSAMSDRNGGEAPEDVYYLAVEMFDDMMHEIKANTDFGESALDEGYRHGSKSIASASNKMEKKRQVAIRKARRLMRDTGCSAEHAAAEYDLLPGDIPKLKQSDPDKKSFSDMTPDEIDRLPKNKRALGHFEEMRRLAGINESYPMTTAQDPEESVNYIQTKRVGDSTVTISADAKSMEDLHRVLKLAGVEQQEGQADANPTEIDYAPEPAEPEVIEPEAEYDAACGCDEPADMGISYSTDKDQLVDAIRQRLANAMRGE